MKLNSDIEQNKNIWISSTGYRIFLELKALMSSPRTLDELIQIIKNDKYLNKEVSKDTVRFDLLTLKAAGCEFLKPEKIDGYTYKLVNHPFKLNISQEELDALLDLREIFAGEISYEEVFILNDLYDKIASLTLDNEIIQNIYSSKLLSNINKDILREISNPALIGKKVQIKYNSPEFGEENTFVSPIKIIYENQKIYLCAYNYKYKSNSLFEISKILAVNSVSINEDDIQPPVFTAVYEVIGNAVNDFELKPYEKIIGKEENKITIEAEVTNEFMFTQRLLLLGKNFKLILPEFYREKLINKIKSIQKRYKNDKI